MAKLWNKGVELDKTIERFTAGEDSQLDHRLATADALGNIAQARMLNSIGILTDDEFKRLKQELLHILADVERGDFVIRPDQEDIHTAIEERLTEKVGDAGKKIHTARSRNDQVALDCRLYARERLLSLRRSTLDLARTLLKFAEHHAEVPMVGRTHTQRAMPSSVGLWASSFAEAMAENAELLSSVYRLVNRCPLGSAASYGVAIPIDREMTSELLGFERPIVNVLYANNTRGKMEAEVLCACAVMMNDLAKLAMDVILFSIPEVGYFLLPEKFCPGSSIMPQKKNPGPLELTRARAAGVHGHLMTALGIVRGLPSGYNRDFQDTKGPMIRGLDQTADTVVVIDMIVRELKVNAQRCIDAFSPEVFAADVALKMVMDDGIPFREAYREIGLNLDKLENLDPVENIRQKTHLGAPGNLALGEISSLLAEQASRLDADAARVKRALEALTEF